MVFQYAVRTNFDPRSFVRATEVEEIRSRGKTGHYIFNFKRRKFPRSFVLTSKGSFLGTVKTLAEYLVESARLVQELEMCAENRSHSAVTRPGQNPWISTPAIINISSDDWERIFDGYQHWQGPQAETNYRRGSSKCYTSASMETVLSLIGHDSSVDFGLRDSSE